MSSNLRKALIELNFVASIKNKKLKKQLLSYLSKNIKYRLAIREIALNLIKGNLKLKQSIKLKLIKHKKQILGANKNLNHKYVVQSGGWLPLIIPVVAALLNIAF